MKTLKSILQFFVLSLVFISTSCENETDDSNESNNCNNPSSISVTRDNFDDSKANLNWSQGETEASWEIQYGHSGFNLGSGTIISSSVPNVIINNLDIQGYDFYVRSVCSTTEFSDWVGPFSINPIILSPPAYMNITINGESYNGMKPYFYSISGLKAKLSFGYDDPDKKIIQIQGDTNPLASPPSNFIQINLSIPENNWNLNENSLSDGDFETESVVNLIIVKGTNTWEIIEKELPGTIKLTEFNPSTKRIKGIFSFQYELYENGIIIGGPYNVQGNFDFECEDEIFQ